MVAKIVVDTEHQYKPNALCSQISATSLAFQLLDLISHALADESMKGGISVAPIIAERVRAGVSGRADVLVFAVSAFACRPGFHAGFVGISPKE